jgi:hypothetical protein
MKTDYSLEDFANHPEWTTVECFHLYQRTNELAQETRRLAAETKRKAIRTERRGIRIERKCDRALRIAKESIRLARQNNVEPFGDVADDLRVHTALRTFQQTVAGVRSERESLCLEAEPFHPA